MDNSKSNHKVYNTEPCSASAINKKYYVIEGVDSEGEDCENNFFNKLKCIIKCNGIGGDDVDIDSCCLLTKEALKDIYITLNCGHKFNYIPLYKEVVIQKTSAGIMTTNGFYNSCTLRLNEMKCPYCRRVQDKLLPFFNYDDIKRLRGVNGPESLCMKARMCEHIETSNKRKKKNTKKEMSDSCECNAIHVVNGVHYCKKHYEQQEKQTQNDFAALVVTENKNEDICGVIVKSGKNKGLPCTNSSSCRIHVHLRKGSGIVAAVASPILD